MSRPIYFVTYDIGNGYLNIDKVIYNNALKKNFTPKFIKGYVLKDEPDIKPTRLMFMNIKDKVLPKLMKIGAKDYLIAEDDAIINFTSEELDIIIKKNGQDNILWIGYQKILHRPGIIDFVVGGQMIYIPRTRLRKMKEVMDTVRPQHYDGFLFRYRDEIGLKIVPQKLNVEFNSNNLYPVPGKLVDEMTRQSSITNIKRKGKDIIAQGKFIEMPLET